MNLFMSLRRAEVRRLKGVSCEVRSCVYHDGDSFCTADRIKVGPLYASATTDTVCATYKPRARR